MVLSSGFANSELESDLMAPVDGLIDSPLQDVLEAVGMGLPVLLVAGTEGTMWLTGRQTMNRAMSRSAVRVMKSGTAMGVGALVTVAGGGAFSIPAVFATRLAFARHGAMDSLSEQVQQDTERVRQIGQSRTAVGA
jgi:hypothetical protein